MTSFDSLSSEQLVRRIADYDRSGDLRSALAACQHLNRSFDEYHYGWYLASCLMLKVNNASDGLKAINKALSLCFLEEYLLQKAQCLFRLGEMSAVKEICKKINSSDFKNSDAHHEFGELFSRLSMYQESLREFNAAISIAPSAVLYYNKATIQRYLGDIDGSESSFSQSIARGFDGFEPFLSRSNLRRQTQENNNIKELEVKIQQVSSITSETPYLYFSLAKELEDLSCDEEAFSALNDANKIKRQLMQYNIDTDLDILKGLSKTYSKPQFNRGVEGEKSVDPIFILGMPRTGTTLVERILESHSSVKSAGELNNFAIEMMKLVKSSGLSPTSRLDLIDKTTQLNFKQLGDAYIKSVEPLRDGSPRFIDKLPFNYLYAGLIHLAMPNAKIINLQRHPMDTCYSVYKQLFKDAYPFSYDLKELGQYYVAYRELMAHWNTVMPGVIHTVNYEDVVADTEGEARKLLDYCWLGWEDQCLRFYENKSASTTASATQVRQKVYSSSVGKWRQYEEQLQPLADILTKAGIDIS